MHPFGIRKADFNASFVHSLCERNFPENAVSGKNEQESSEQIWNGA